jgi:hypothetical protein
MKMYPAGSQENIYLVTINTPNKLKDLCNDHHHQAAPLSFHPAFFFYNYPNFFTY